MDWRRELMGGVSSEINNYLAVSSATDVVPRIKFSNTCEYWNGTGEWTELPENTYIYVWDTVFFRANLKPTTSEGIGKFTTEGTINLSGNCMSMLFGDNAADNYSLSGYNYAFYELFRGCGVINVSKNFLPATTLADSCYYRMFGDCLTLTTAPELPAITLTTTCYARMFENCTNLETTPELPATTLATSCYNNMFHNCTSIVISPELPATTLANSCYYRMFDSTNILPDCSSIDFTSSSVVASGGLKGLFYGTKVTDTDLVNILPKNESGNYCLPVTELANTCYNVMFRNCTNLTVAPVLPAITLAQSCYEEMFSGCINLTVAPELPATTLAIRCYYEMFYNCSKLNYIKMLATDISKSSCLVYWVYNVASTGTFVKNSAMTSLPTGVSGIPEGWTVKDHIFTFTFDGDTYTAEYNMTIAEWIESDYNTGGYYIDGSFIYGPNGSSDSSFPSDIIEEGDNLAANAPA